jgi:hypothetical protein
MSIRKKFSEHSFQGVLTVAAEVSWLLSFSFQFITRLAAVFAEEVGDFGVFTHDGYI